ncbi:hypothetical protein T06_14472 [Trichinella sp. T6]|nr:hypothetical protein T06_14472 [Trichinella sp. T6]
MSRHSLRPDLSHPLECMPCFQSSARGFRRGYAMNEIIISEAKANITEDSHKLCQRINDSSLFIISVAATKVSDNYQRLTAQADAQASYLG